MTLDNNRILSQPLKIHWAGWETDTYRLQSQGWEISAEQFIDRRSMRLALRHREIGFRGMTNELNFDYFMMADHRNYDPSYLNSVRFNCRLASDYRIQDMSMGNEFCFQPIDARPAYINYETKSIDDFAHFRPINLNAKEIFLKEASMGEILEIALQKQEPNQEEIRKKLIHREKMEAIKKESRVQAELRLVA